MLMSALHQGVCDGASPAGSGCTRLRFAPVLRAKPLPSLARNSKLCVVNLVFLLAMQLLWSACSTAEKEAVSTSQNNGFRDGGLTIIMDTTSYVNEQTHALVFFENKDFKILDAHAYCPDVQYKGVDTLNSKLLGCNRRLDVQNDTIGIYVTPVDTNRVGFDNVRILYKDEKHQIHVNDTSFGWSVKERKEITQGLTLQGSTASIRNTNNDK